VKDNDHEKIEIVNPGVKKYAVTKLRSLAASFPGFASLGQGWNELETQRTHERIEYFLQRFSEDAAHFAAKIDNLEAAVRKCETFPELLVNSIEMVQREASREKVSVHARILARFVTTDAATSHDAKVTLMQSIDQLTSKDIDVLLLARGKKTFQLRDLEYGTLELDENHLNVVWVLSSHMAKLESRGLLVRTSNSAGVIIRRNGESVETAKALNTEYLVLPWGERLIGALDN